MSSRFWNAWTRGGSTTVVLPPLCCVVSSSHRSILLSRSREGIRSWGLTRQWDRERRR
jgi:hypothetical protein